MFKTNINIYFIGYDRYKLSEYERSKGMKQLDTPTITIVKVNFKV